MTWGKVLAYFNLAPGATIRLLLKNISYTVEALSKTMLSTSKGFHPCRIGAGKGNE